MPKTLHIAILEPYYGGSHAAFVDAFVAYSRHRTTTVGLPTRKWKWRMRGAAMWFTRDAGGWMRPGRWGSVDAILCSDMLSVADLRALLPQRLRPVPIVCYFHENQLTYPLPPGTRRDYQYGMTNITSCLAADAVWFNSRFHQEDFLAAADRLLRKMPDFVPAGVLDEIRRKSAVYPPPVDAARMWHRFPTGEKHGLQTPTTLRGIDSNRPPEPRNRPCTILWCHRWEFDKNPEPFFEALLRLDELGYAFDLVLLGEQFRTAPPVFADAWPRLTPHIVHAGFLPDRNAYLAMLPRCDLVVSTAIQENFGIGVIEAILAGCRPLLPKRLAYPEIVPRRFHEVCLYDRDDDLFDRLRRILEATRSAPESSEKPLAETQSGTDVPASEWLIDEQMSDLTADLHRRFAAPTAVERMDDALSWLVNS